MGYTQTWKAQGLWLGLPFLGTPCRSVVFLRRNSFDMLWHVCAHVYAHTQTHTTQCVIFFEDWFGLNDLRQYPYPESGYKRCINNLINGLILSPLNFLKLGNNEEVHNRGEKTICSPTPWKPLLTFSNISCKSLFYACYILNSNVHPFIFNSHCEYPTFT